MMIKKLIIVPAAAVLLALAMLAVGCNEAPPDETAAAAITASATPAGTSGDTQAAGGEGCGGSCCGDGAKELTAAAEGKAGGCADCPEGKVGGGTLSLSGMQGCDGECADCTGAGAAGGAKVVEAAAAGAGEAGCAGCAEGDKPAGGCSTCPGTAKTLTTMAGDEKVVLAVSGMTCASCENAIRETLATVKGVKLGIADHKLGRAWVAYDPQVANVQVISAAITKLGYTVGEELEHVAALPALKAGHQRSAVYIDGMGCPDCTGEVNQTIKALGGVDALALDRQFNILFVDYDPATVQPALFKAKLIEIGYAAALPGEALTQPAKAHCEGCAKAEATADAA